MLMGLGCGHVEILQTRFPQAHTLHRFTNTETTLTSTAPETVQTTGSTSHMEVECATRVKLPSAQELPK